MIDVTSLYLPLSVAIVGLITVVGAVFSCALAWASLRSVPRAIDRLISESAVTREWIIRAEERERGLNLRLVALERSNSCP